MMWDQTYSLFGLGLGPSAILAATPIFTLVLLLGVLRLAAWKAGAAGLVVSLVLALAGYHMPVASAVSAAADGVAFGLFPISWIIFWAIALFRVTEETGRFEIIRHSVGSLTSDPRRQALLIAFAFGAFLEGAAGFGTPVAIAATMLTGLGFPALRASALCLIANTAPVAFGSIGIPVITLAGTTGLSLYRLSGAIGWLCAPIALILPAYMIAALWGFGSLAGVMLEASVAGAVYASVQFLISNYIGPQLTDILAGIATMVTLMLMFRLRPEKSQSAGSSRSGSSFSSATQTTSSADAETEARSYSPSEIAGAWLPYALLVICVLAWGYKPVQTVLESVSFTLRWPFLHDLVRRMPPVVSLPTPYHALFRLNWLAAAGTACMAATCLSAVSMRLGLRIFFDLILGVTRQLLIPTMTVSLVLASAFLMNYCGATATLGLGFAAAGAIFPFCSAVLGWVGVFLTGSDTSSNALFGTLQVVTADRLHLSPVLMAAANSAGGVMGKMISLQTIAVAAAATGISVDDQAKLFRFALKHSLVLVGLVGCLALIYSYLIRVA